MEFVVADVAGELRDGAAAAPEAEAAVVEVARELAEVAEHARIRSKVPAHFEANREDYARPHGKVERLRERRVEEDDDAGHGEEEHRR